MYGTLDRFSEQLDFVRSRSLRITLKFKWLRPYFERRAHRLGLLFLLSCSSAGIISLAFPLWALLLGPLVYGVPHVFSSLRYFHYRVRPREGSSPGIMAILGGFVLCVVSYRLFVTLNVMNLNIPQLSEWRGSTYLELMALGFIYVLGCLLYRLRLGKISRGVIFLTPFYFAFITWPALTVGALVLIHNFVAFVYWIGAAENKSDRAVAGSALLLAAVITAGIFLGTFDSIIFAMHPRLALDFANLTVQDTGQLIFPPSHFATAFRPHLWLHACIAFAFGQMLHYFVWLKAVPDQYHYHETPTSFRQSLRLLQKDFGKRLTLACILACIGTWIVWCFLSFGMARLVYFSLASFHGYLEIAGLALGGFSRSRLKQARVG